MSTAYKDLINRALWTFVQAATGIIIADALVDFGDVEMWKLAGGAGAAAVFSLVKSFAGQQLNRDNVN